MKRWCNNVDWGLEFCLPNINNIGLSMIIAICLLKISNFRPQYRGYRKVTFSGGQALINHSKPTTHVTQTQYKYKIHKKGNLPF